MELFFQLVGSRTGSRKTLRYRGAMVKQTHHEAEVGVVQKSVRLGLDVAGKVGGE